MSWTRSKISKLTTAAVDFVLHTRGVPRIKLKVTEENRGREEDNMKTFFSPLRAVPSPFMSPYSGRLQSNPIMLPFCKFSQASIRLGRATYRTGPDQMSRKCGRHEKGNAKHASGHYQKRVHLEAIGLDKIISCPKWRGCLIHVLHGGISLRCLKPMEFAASGHTVQ